MIESHALSGPAPAPRTAPPGQDPDAALAPLLADVAVRLRPACAHFAPGEFDRLVLDIARTKRRWADQDREIR